MSEENHKIVIDVIVPAYNESDGIVKHIERMMLEVRQEGYRPHMILVDDGSNDNTWEEIQALSRRYEEVMGVRHSRNFGKDNALFTGLNYAFGHASITIDGDGQHPPSLIPKILQAWNNGALIVNVVKKERNGETLTMRIRAGLFNYIMSRLTHTNQNGASDYKLLDKQAVKILCQHETSDAIYRYSVTNLGFPSANIYMDTVPAERPSRWRMISLFEVATRAIMFHTDVPLKAFVILTILIILMSVGLIFNLVAATFRDAVPSGYSTLLILNLLTLGITIVGLTGLGVYLKGMLDIVTRRSSAIVWEQTENKRLH
jgi:dolichol-phosphate mannosyltransferase